MRQGSFVSPATLKAVAELLSNMAETAVPAGCGCREFETPCFRPRFEEPCGCEMPRWGVTGCPPEDRNKRFGIHVGNVDEPRRNMFCTEHEFLRARAAYDRLVDAVEDIDWNSASDCTPLHRVNCIRRPVHMGPPMGINLVGESDFFPRW